MWRIWTRGWGVRSWWIWFRSEGLPMAVAWSLPKNVALWTFIRVYGVKGDCGPDYEPVYKLWEAEKVKPWPRRMKRVLFSLSLLVCWASVASAQTTATAAWTQTEAPPIANALVNTMRVDSLAAVPLTTTCVAATAPATGSVCSATFPLAGSVTNHSYILTVCNSGGLCSAASASTGGTVPGTGGFKVTITITVTGT